jgi:tetratricopeptide (TPR) repeat protein
MIMIMRAIRSKRRAMKIPMIIFTVAIAISLVGVFAYTPLDVPANQQAGQASQVQTMLDYSRQLEQALKLDPENKDLHVSLGNILYDIGAYYAGAGDEAKAVRYFKEATVPYLDALAIDPQLLGVRVDMATAAYYSGLYDLAEEHFLEAIEQDPGFVNARINYGHFLYYAKGEPEKALEQWEAAAALELEPAVRANVEALINMAK